MYKQIVLLAILIATLTSCDSVTQSKLICEGREQVVSKDSVQTKDVKYVIATLHKSYFGTSKSIELRSETTRWIDAIFCYKTGSGTDYFRGPTCADTETTIELDKSNGRLFVHRAPYPNSDNVVSEDKYLLAEYFCRNAEPLK